MVTKQTILKKILYLSLALALLLSGLGLSAGPAAAAAPLVCTRYHVVQEGESLYNLARRYRVSWRWLADVNHITTPTRLKAGSELCVEATQESAIILPDTGSGSRLEILAVRQDRNVTIRVVDFLPNREVRVLMDVYSSGAGDGYVAGAAETDRNGALTDTFDIPSELDGRSKIAIRVEVIGRGHFYLDSWFDNSNLSRTTTRRGLSVVRVVEDESVSIRAASLPADRTFSVWLDWRNNRYNDVRSIQVGRLTTNSDGSLNATIKFPREVRDRTDLAVRLEAADGSGLVFSVWFFNLTGTYSSTGSSEGNLNDGPYMNVTSVNANGSLAIQVHNFPPRRQLSVLIGKVNDFGEGGTRVGSLVTNNRGEGSLTVSIPAGLQSQPQLAVRVEGNGDIFAYTWFNTVP